MVKGKSRQLLRYATRNNIPVVVYRYPVHDPSKHYVVITRVPFKEIVYFPTFGEAHAFMVENGGHRLCMPEVITRQVK